MGKLIRIQRKRTKGWRMPENTVYVGRPTRWGNPFKVGRFVSFGPLGWFERTEFGERMMGEVRPQGILGERLGVTDTYVVDSAVATAMFAVYVEQLKYPPSYSGLRGQNLACWCRLDQPCHADVLLEIANA